MGPNSTLMQSKWSVTGRLICWGRRLDEGFAVAVSAGARYWTPGHPVQSGITRQTPRAHVCPCSLRPVFKDSWLRKAEFSSFFYFPSRLMWISASRSGEGAVLSDIKAPVEWRCVCRRVLLSDRCTGRIMLPVGDFAGSLNTTSPPTVHI